MTADFAVIRRKLQRERAMDHQGVTRTPRPRHCHRCGLAVIAAITDSGITTAVWPHPTTVLGELSALSAGLMTFALRPGRMFYRGKYEIKGRSADEIDVHVIHACGMPPPEINHKRIPATTKETNNGTPLPF